jgi:hypothetical protein
MTAKEKAIEIVDKFKLDPIKPLCIMHYEHSKQCALIAVDEIINNIPCREEYGSSNGFILIDNTEYWQEVKTELEKL